MFGFVRAKWILGYNANKEQHNPNSTQKEVVRWQIGPILPTAQTEGRGQIMHEWNQMHRLGLKELTEMPIGTRVRCRMFGGKLTGEIVDIQQPEGLLSPRFKVKWDNPDDGISGWMHKSDLHIIEAAHEAE
jgi:hypothetical protein